MMRTYPLDIIEKYKSGKALTALAKEYDSSWRALKYFFKRNGVKIRGQKKHSLNKEYFKNLDSHEKAYFLGLLWADGSIMKFRKTDNFLGKVRLSLVEEDSYLIEALRVAIEHKGKLGHVKKEGNRQDQKSLQIADKEFAAHVEKLGMKPNKTYDGGFPVVSEEFMSSFILGYFDGDGSFSAWENKKRVERKCIYTLAVHPDTCTFIKNHLDKIGLESFVFPIKDRPIDSLVISGNANCAKFFNFIYSNSDKLPIFLKRKYLKAKFFLEKYGALTKLRFNIPKKTNCDKILKWGEKNLSPKTFSDLKKEWKEIQGRENLVPGPESSKRFLPNELNSPLITKKS